MFIVKINKSCIITYLGVIFGVLSMYLALESKLVYSLICLALSGVCDMFDGKVARMCKRTEEEKNFGIQLDSLADTFNFLAVPVVIMLALGYNSVIAVILYSLLALAGVSRLAFFNIHADMDNPVKYYSGLPVTSTAIIYPVLGLLNGHISSNYFEYMYLVATGLIAFLFVFNFKCPKLKGKFYVIIPLLALVLIFLLLVMSRVL